MAIIQRGDDKIVFVAAAGGGAAERKVVTGITGSTGMVEIISGLTEGERITSFSGGR